MLDVLVDVELVLELVGLVLVELVLVELVELLVELVLVDVNWAYRQETPP